LDVDLLRARVGRLSVTGELGYELNVPATELATLYRAVTEAAAGLDAPVAPIGYRALDSLRLEKSFGIWSREYTWAYTPAMSGLDRFVAYDKAGFIGRDAALRERDTGPAQRLVTLVVEATDADAATFEPVWIGPRRVGFVTSGGYGHSLGESLALAYLDADVAVPDTAVEIHVVGERIAAQVVPASPHDPSGARQRG